MNPFFWLGLTVVLVVGVALTGTGPKGGKPVARTRLMKSARFFLIFGILVCGGIALSAVVRH
jgi:hypothetical protein